MELIKEINRLKKERNTVILAHNYQLPEIQDIADYVGDSLGLSIQASKTGADVIVFCGVYFMAETAKILSPAKTVLIPDKNAGCPMADMITAEELRKLKAQHPKAKALCYVNTTAAVKAECDVCCTSGNAEIIVREAFHRDDEIIFVPDQYLAGYIAGRADRRFILWKGFCPTHVRILPEDIAQKRALYKNAEVLVHPECPVSITSIADQVLSTEGMCRYVKESNAREFIIGTETGILHRMQKENPGKIFYPASERATCPNMKLTTLEKVLWSLEEMRFAVTVPRDVMQKAKTCLQRMIDYKP
ncbi:MAG TPA: quinolinate synthase NadA [Smithella sp.]|nr:quinolinate synthase NadA [Smithella sp.]MDM7988108.1 quinolinate synthase NadA [Smithella sp.]HNY49170.1 quinolinate synthase NadA [Smithella sp.]HOG90046.1 quinolinate synthase NadA [Smithella sp.]HOU49616.1 quinolinate synthase NadA [Smithella sp.]